MFIMVIYSLLMAALIWYRIILPLKVRRVWKILLANCSVLRIILSHEQRIRPVLVQCHTGLKTEFCRFLLANTITLTPGTITVSLQEDRLTVHCLRSDMLDDMECGLIVRLLQRLEA